MTFEQVEKQIAQLPPREQRELVAHTGERLSASMPVEVHENRQPNEYAAQVGAFLKLCEDIAAETVGEVDSAEDIRQIREERMGSL